MACSCVVVWVSGCSGLLPGDSLTSSSDPYVKAKVGGVEAASPVLKHTLEPRWTRDGGPWYHVFVVDGIVTSLKLKVKDKDRLTKSDLLGLFVEDLSHAEDSRVYEREEQLQVPQQLVEKGVADAGTIRFAYQLVQFGISSILQLQGGMELSYARAGFFAKVGCSSAEDYLNKLRTDTLQGISDDAGELLCRKYAYGENIPHASEDFSEKQREEWSSIYRKMFHYYVKAVRGGNTMYLSNEDLLVGDIIFLEQDVFLDVSVLLLSIFDEELKVSQLRMTGDSGSISKDHLDVVSAGSVVLEGRGLGVVVAVGSKSYWGKKMGTRDLGVIVEDVVFNGSMGVDRYYRWWKDPREPPYCLISEGYLTLHRKSVVQAWLCGDMYSGIVTPNSQPSVLDLPDECQRLLQTGIAVNTRGRLVERRAGLIESENASHTDAALLHFLRFIYGSKLEVSDLRGQAQDFPFENGLKSCIVQNRCYTLGYAHHCVGKVSHWLAPEGQVHPIGDKLESILRSMASLHLAPVILAYKDSTSTSRIDLESEMTLVGVFGIKAPTLSTAKEAVSILRASNVHCALMTSQPMDVACMVARECGILTEEEGAQEAVLTGEQFLRMSTEDQLANATRICVMGLASADAKEAVVLRLKQVAPVCFMGKSAAGIAAAKSADLSVALDSGDDSSKAMANVVVVDNDLLKAVLVITKSPLFKRVGSKLKF